MTHTSLNMGYMGHIWLIYRLDMGYLTEFTIVEALHGLFKYLIVFTVRENIM